MHHADSLYLLQPYYKKDVVNCVLTVDWLLGMCNGRALLNKHTTHLTSIIILVLQLVYLLVMRVADSVFIIFTHHTAPATNPLSKQPYCICCVD